MNFPELPALPKLTIACDVDDTLLGWPGDIPNHDLAEWLDFQRLRGHNVFLWSWAGSERGALANKALKTSFPTYSKSSWRWNDSVRGMEAPDIAFDDRRPFPEDYGPPVWPNKSLYLVGFKIDETYDPLSSKPTSAYGEFYIRAEVPPPQCGLCHDTGHPFIVRLSAAVGQRDTSKDCECVRTEGRSLT